MSGRIYQVRDYNPYENFHRVMDLGEGGFGSVSLHTSNGRTVAIKRYKKDDSGRQEFTFELEAFERIGLHRHIVRFLAAFEDSDGLNIALEYCQMGDLERIYQDFDRYNEKDVRDIAVQVCQALEHMRSKSAAHRDIKPGNILVRKWKPIDVVLADLNFSKLADQSRANHLTVFRTDLGTNTYKAPEVSDRSLRDKGKYNHKCDSWSLGIVLFQLMSGRNDPFACSEEKFREVLEECDSFAQFKWEIVEANAEVYEAGVPQFQPEEAWENVSEEGREAVRMLLQKEFQKRWDFMEVINSSWGQKDFGDPRDLPQMFNKVQFEQRNEDLRALFATYADFGL